MPITVWGRIRTILLSRLAVLQVHNYNSILLSVCIVPDVESFGGITRGDHSPNPAC